MGSENRKRTLHIMVRVSPAEKKEISDTAAQCRLSAAGYLRELGLGFQPKNIVDYAQVREMARINGDLGRLGGLLKLWLNDDKKMQLFSEKDILKILEDIESARLELVRTMSRVLLPRK